MNIRLLKTFMCTMICQARLPSLLLVSCIKIIDVIELALGLYWGNIGRVFQDHMKVLLSSFHLKSHTSVFYPQTQTLTK